MNFGLQRSFIITLFAFYLMPEAVEAKLNTKNVILITLDGIRWQEVFTGADSSLIFNKTFTKDSARIVNQFWDDDENQRRQKLLPFFWSTIADHGQLVGNVQKGSAVELKNPHWFSYPGYSEILVGYVDSTRNSNARENNPNITVLEYIHNQPGFKGQVAAFCSWDVFDYIINEQRAGFTVNSGMEKFEETYGSQKAKLLNELLFQVPVPWGSVRYDAFTYQYAFDFLQRHKPRLLYIAFDETDEYAHEGEYGQYLNAANALDGFIQNIWEWTQSDYRYKNKTTLIVTTDHGRGDDPIDYWRHHGSDVQGAEKVWLAVLGPDTPALGETKNMETLYSSQIAKTISTLLGVEYTNNKAVGNFIERMIHE
jgi:hypothetical protein